MKQVSLSGYIDIAYGYFKNYNHVLLGVFLFSIMKMVFERIDFWPRIKQFLNITDKFSYETYLVHQFLILGPFSLMTLTPYLGINILLILIGICILAWLLKQAENKILKVIAK